MVDYGKLAADFVQTSPTWGPFLVAFGMTLVFCWLVLKYILKVLVSNGLTMAVNKLADKMEGLPDKVGAAVALRILEHSLQQKYKE